MSGPERPAPYVFLSYARKDQQRAEYVAEQLTAAGVRVWMDRQAIAGGASWASQIVEAIKGCAVLVLLVSEASTRSRNVTREAQLAWSEECPYLPLLLDPVAIPDQMRYFLEGCQWVEVLDRPSTDWLADVVRALARLGVTAAAPLPQVVSTARGPAGSAANRWTNPEPGRLPQESHPLATGPMVGRARELALLRARLDAAVDGRGSLALLVGEPGIGKTRLMEAVASDAAERSMAVLWGRCHEGDGAPAYWPWLQTVRGYVRLRDPESLRRELGAGAPDIAAVVAEVRAALPDLPFPPALAPDQARFRLFDSMAAFLRRAAADRPLVLLLDDLHWADLSSLLLLQFLVRELAEMRLLIVAAYRDVELDRQHPLAAVLAELRRERLHERLPLGGLSPDEVGELLRELAGAEIDAAGRRLAAALHEETEGNPFFISEIVRHLLESGRIAVRDGRWVHVPERIGDLGLPEGVREVLGRRLSRLSDPCNRALGVAAIIGRDFDLPTLARAGRGAPAHLPEDADALLELLAEAETARLVTETPRAPGRYRFAHALVRETLLEELTTAQRVRLHRRVGEALEAQHRTNLRPHLFALAQHFFEAAPGGATEKAIDYACRAAEQALSQGAYEDAARQYERALQLLDLQEEPDPRRQLDLLLLLARAQYWGDALQPRHAALARAHELARLLGDGVALARIAVASDTMEEGDVNPDPALVRLEEEALAALDEGDSPLRAELMARLAHALEHAGHAGEERTRMLASEAVAMARRLGDPTTLTHVLATVRSMHDASGQPLVSADELLRVATQTGDASYVVLALTSRIQIHLEAGDIRAMDTELRSARRFAEEMRSRAFALWYDGYAAFRLLIAGEYAQAQVLIGDLMDRVRQFGSMSLLAQAGMRRFCVERELGQLAGRIDGLRRALERSPNVVIDAQIAWALIECGRPEEARPYLDKLAGDGFAAVLRYGRSVPVLAMLAEVCAALGDAPRAEQLYPLLLPRERETANFGDTAFWGAFARHLGLLATTLQRWDDAERHFADALTMNERMPSPPWAAWTRHDWARMLLARRAPGDRERALAMLDDALAAARRLGMVRLEQAAGALREHAEALHEEGVARRRAAYPAGLSEREVEVLRMIAAGRSNPQIADELVLSVRTVERHAVNIYAKLGAASRIEAANWAQRNGLVTDL
jgi:DNA-binding CsgD family transcriptional regulator